MFAKLCVLSRELVCRATHAHEARVTAAALAHHLIVLFLF